MRRPSLAEDLVSAKDFQENMPHWMSKIALSGRPLVITNNGRAAAVLMDPTTLDEFEESKEVVRRVVRGLEDVEAGRVHDDALVWGEIEELIQSYEVKKP